MFREEALLLIRLVWGVCKLVLQWVELKYMILEAAVSMMDFRGEADEGSGGGR
jgi:hypothetical protein